MLQVRGTPLFLEITVDFLKDRLLRFVLNVCTRILRKGASNKLLTV